MYEVIVYESAKELIDALVEKCLPSTVFLVLDGGSPRLSGDGAKRFYVDDHVTQDDVISEAMSRIGVRVHLT